MRVAIFFVASVLAATQLFGQYPFTRTFEVRVGQRRPHITEIVQAGNGLLWVGSDLGIYRTDGERTDAMHLTEGVAVKALSWDPTGVIAVMEDGVLLHCNDRGCDTLAVLAGITGLPVNDVHRDASGAVWLATYGRGVWIWKDGALSYCGRSEGLLDEHVNAMLDLGGDGMLLGTDQGLALVGTDSKVVRTYTSREGVPDNLILSLARDEEGRIWAGTDRAGIFSFSASRSNMPEFEVLLQDGDLGPVRHLVVSEDRLWTGGTGEGLVVHEIRNGIGTYRPSNIVEGRGSKVRDALLARDGAVWMCDGTEVLRRSDPGVLYVVDHEAVDLRAITALCSDESGRICFATSEGVYDHTAAFADRSRLNRFPITPGRNTPVIALRYGPDRTLWAGTFGNGAFRVTKEGAVAHFTRSNAGLNENVLAIRTLGREVWMATLDGIFMTRDGEAREPVFERIPIPGSGFVYDVLPLPDGPVLAATDGAGVVRVERDGSTRALLGQDPERRTYYSLALGPDGSIWATGPLTGACRVVGDVLHCAHAEAPVFQKDIFSLAAYRGRMVVLGNDGLVAFDPDKGPLVPLGDETGLRNVLAELNTICTDVFGSLWLATDKGLVRFDLDVNALSGTIPAVLVSCHWGDEALPTDRELRLRHDQDLLTFQFTGEHHAAPENVRFAYQLVGYDVGPKITRDREATYARLPPGDYVFQVRAFLGEGDPGPTTAEFAFTIAPPWWRRTWFTLLVAVVLTSLLYVLVRSREARLGLRDRMEKEKARFQLEALRSQVNPHFLFNSFNTLIELIEENKDLAVAHVEQLSDLFRSILQVRDKDLIPLHEEMDLLENYFALEERRFGPAIELHMDIPTDRRDHLIPPLTLQLLVENAIKHNVASVQEPLVMSITVVGDRIVVRNPYRPRTGVPSTGFGLDSIGKRYKAFTKEAVQVDIMNGEFKVGLPLIAP